MNAPWNPNKRANGLAPREAFAAFVCDTATADTIRPVAVDIGWAGDRINAGGLHNAVQTLSVSASPQILLVDLSEAADPLSDINMLAEVCEPGTLVLALGDMNDVRLYRDLIASGIHDYLLKPLNPDHLREVLLGAQAALSGPRSAPMSPDEPQPHLAVTVVGVRGGVGASTVASSLAWMLAERAGRSAALLDLDLHFGTGALSFDVEPGRGLTDALENPSRIDGLFIERAMVRATQRLAILSAEAPMAQSLAIDGDALHHLQEEMRGSFDGVVVDLPRGMAVQHPGLIADATDIVLVTEQTLAATRDTIRMLGWLKTVAPGARIVLVANRVSNAPEVTRKDIEASVERRIDVLLPADPKAATDAARHGKALADAARGALDTAYAELLAILSGGQAKAIPASQSLMDRLNLKKLMSLKRN